MLLNLVPVLLEQFQPLRQAGVAQPLQIRIFLHLLDGHTRRPQLVQELDPPDVVLRIPTVGILNPVDGMDEADALVIAQGVNTQSGHFRAYAVS